MSQERDRVVLCEGRRDVRLLKRFHDRERHCSCDTFHGGNYTADNLKNFESNKLQQFTGRRNRDDVFLKSEGGLTDLKPLFARLARPLFHTFEVAVCLVVDLDRADHDRWDGLGGRKRYHDLLDGLDERVDDIYTRNCGITHDQFYRRGQYTFAAQATFTHDGYAPAAFDVLAFRSSLEDAAGITDEDDEEDETAKLDAFLTENPESFDRVL
ncbi:MAG: hypothetical protein J07HB67_02315 [halophilic archaeon J07HB67]|jgi:hypothetical protein|nr:MAG: hypothetical protein J07HB67_02315 [halophilic archaeon J07HB67]